MNDWWIFQNGVLINKMTELKARFAYMFAAKNIGIGTSTGWFPSCHHYGFAVLDELSRSMRVARHFHGHHHDDRTHEYAAQRDELGFDAVALGFCAVKNGLGEVLFPGLEG